MSQQVTVAERLLTHPTTKLLRAKLGAAGALAFVTLVLHAAPTKGGLGQLTPRKLAFVTDWDGGDDELFDAMVECGAIDTSNPDRVVLTDRESMYRRPATRSGHHWGDRGEAAPAAPALAAPEVPNYDKKPPRPHREDVAGQERHVQYRGAVGRILPVRLHVQAPSRQGAH